MRELTLCSLSHFLWTTGVGFKGCKSSGGSLPSLCKIGVKDEEDSKLLHNLAPHLEVCEIHVQFDQFFNYTLSLFSGNAPKYTHDNGGCRRNLYAMLCEYPLFVI